MQLTFITNCYEHKTTFVKGSSVKNDILHKIICMQAYYQNKIMY